MTITLRGSWRWVPVINYTAFHNRKEVSGTSSSSLIFGEMEVELPHLGVHLKYGEAAPHTPKKET